MATPYAAGNAGPANAVLVTDGSKVPSLSTTLPNGLALGSPASGVASPLTVISAGATAARALANRFTLNLLDFEGASCDYQAPTVTVTINASSHSLLATGATFTSGDVGKTITVLGAGPAGAQLVTTISAFTDATHVTLTLAASTTVTTTSQIIYYGTDNAGPFNAGLTAVGGAGGGWLMVPASQSCGVNGRLTFPGQTYLTSPGTFVSSIDLLSDIQDYLIYSSSNNVGVTNITLNMNNFDGGANGGATGFASVANALVDHVYIANMGKYAITGTGLVSYQFTYNLIGKNTPSPHQNEAIFLTNSFASSYGKIAYNRLIGSGMLLNTANTDILENDISGWGYGGAITLPQLSTVHDVKMQANVLHNSVGPIDDNSTWPLGIEDWGANDTHTANTVYGNVGVGFSFGGPNCTATGNIAYDNGSGTTGLDNIVMSYFNSTYNGSGCTLSGNRSFNTRGVSGPARYAYAEASSLLSGIVLSGNNFTTGSAGVTQILSATTTTPLTPARTINGVTFDGSQNITISATAASITSGSTAATGFTNGHLVGVASGTTTDVSIGTGVLTALGVNVGSAGAPVLFNGAGGTPSSLTGTNITGTASGLTAGNVTTNANLTGVITSSGNATSIASQTGTGTKFVVDTSPALVTPTVKSSSGDSTTAAQMSISQPGSVGWDVGIAATTGNWYIDVNTGTPQNAYVITRSGGAVTQHAWLVGGSNVATIDASGFKQTSGTTQLAAYTVSTLPSTSATGRTTGAQAYVTDAIACTFLATVTGGGSTFCPVVWNGANWQGG